MGPIWDIVVILCAGCTIGGIVLLIKLLRKIYIKHEVEAEWETVVRTLESCKHIQDIADNPQVLSKFSHRKETEKLVQHERMFLVQLREVIHVATRLGTTFPDRERREVLADLQEQLCKVHIELTSSNVRLSSRLVKVIEKWQEIAGQAQEWIGKSQGIYLDNPYIPGQVLRAQSNLFVGRRDLIQQLERELSNKKPPIFFLYGERRMGKSSVLAQLPFLLSARYTSILY